MTPELLSITAVGLVNYLVDAVLWGISGYVIFRALGGRDSRWWLGASAAFVVYLVVDEMLPVLMATTMQLQLGEPSISELIGEDGIDTDWFDVVMCALVTFGGFHFGRRVVVAAIKRGAETQALDSGTGRAA